jgi:sugar/nucleoside kinase (ribokinase family)
LDGIAVHRPDLPAFPVPAERVSDTSGAGDVFHGAYIYSYLTKPTQSWQDHFDFARAASTFKVQNLGSEAGLPTLQDIDEVNAEFDQAALRPGRWKTAATSRSR